MQPNQYPNQPGNPAPLPPNNGGAWDFLQTPSEPPKKKSFFQEYKKLIIVFAVAVVVLVGLAIAGSLSSNSSNTAGEESNSAAITETSVPTNDYDGEYFSAKYASSLNINIDEAIESPSGWFLHFAEDPEVFTYDIAIQAGDEQPSYQDGVEAIEAFLAEQDYEPSNIITPAVVLAGNDTIKTLGEYTNSDGEERYVVYATTEVSGKYVIVNGTYPKDNTDIVDSFDAMLASIRLK